MCCKELRFLRNFCLFTVMCSVSSNEHTVLSTTKVPPFERSSKANVICILSVSDTVYYVESSCNRIAIATKYCRVTSNEHSFVCADITTTKVLPFERLIKIDSLVIFQFRILIIDINIYIRRRHPSSYREENAM